MEYCEMNLNALIRDIVHLLYKRSIHIECQEYGQID